jgi:hypothetical protein
VRAIARQELVPELVGQRDVAVEHLARQQSFEELVVAAVSVAPREPEHAGKGVCLEHGANGVRRCSEPVDRRPALALEVEGRERPVGADPFEHPVGDLGILGEVSHRARADRHAEPRELFRGDEREPLVVRLEDPAPFVEEVAPRGVVVRDARVEHEVVVPARHRDRVVLDRAEPPEHLEHRVRPTLEQACGCEQLALDEEAARGLGGDLHAGDAIGAKERPAWRRPLSHVRAGRASGCCS